MANAPLVFDRALLRRRLDRAAVRFDDADFLKRRAAEDLVDRLHDLMGPFPTAVDLGARTGAFRRALAASPAADRVGLLIETDLSAAMLRREAGARAVVDEERLPFRVGALDLIVASSGLHLVNDLPGALVQIRRALRPGGLFLGAMFGGGTLFELRRALIEAETDLRGGAGPRVAPFVDPADATALMQRAGFADPSVELDRVTVRYAGLARLFADLRRMGETAVMRQRAREPLTPRLAAAAEAIYRRDYGDPDGRLPATFETLILTGSGPRR